MICDKAQKAAVLLENVQRGETPGLKMIILMDAFDTQLLEEAQKCSVHIRALRDVEVRCVQLHCTEKSVQESHLKITEKTERMGFGDPLMVGKE